MAKRSESKRLEGVPEVHRSLVEADSSAVYDPVDTYRELTEEELNPPAPEQPPAG